MTFRSGIRAGVAKEKAGIVKEKAGAGRGGAPTDEPVSWGTGR